jgi:large subunit ribosomal protein L30e
MLNKSLIHHFHGNNTDLGIACGKLFKCSCLGVMDPGDTDLTALLL